MRTLILAVLACGSVAQAQQPETLTNDTIIRMVQAGVPTNAIIQTIDSASSVNFNFIPQALTALGQARVPDEVVRAMAARDRRVPTAPAVQIQQPTAQSQPPSPPQSSFGETFQDKGMWDLNFQAAFAVSHESGSSSTLFATALLGQFITRGNEVGFTASVLRLPGGFTTTSILGGYRYYFPLSDRVLPFVGGGVGGAIAHIPGITEGHFAAAANAGIRSFVARKIAIDLNYTLQYVRIQGAGFSGSTASAVSVGFAHVFGGR